MFWLVLPMNYLLLMLFFIIEIYEGSRKNIFELGMCLQS